MPLEETLESEQGFAEGQRAEHLGGASTSANRALTRS
jgi:hypothetical protein